MTRAHSHDASEGLVSRRSFVSSSILVGESVVRLGLAAAVSFWIAVYLGPEKFGLLNYASALVMVFWSIAMLGLDTPVIASLTRRPQEQGLILGSALVLRLASGSVCALAACAAVAIMRPGDSLVLLLVAVVSLSMMLSAPLLLDAWFKAHNHALPAAIARIAGTVLAALAKIGCLLLGAGVVALAWTVALEAALGAAALLLAYQLRVGRSAMQPLRYRIEEVKSLLHASWPFALSTAAIAAYMKIDIILLGMYSTNVEIGLYGLCQRLSEVLYVLPVIVVDVLYPQLVRHKDAGSDPANASQTFFDLSFAIAVPATVLAIAAVYWLVPWLFGAAYARTADFFAVHAFSCIGVALAHARYKWMAASGLQNLAPAVAGLGLVIALVLNWWLIPRHGAMGAAVATVVAYFCSAFLVTFLFSSLRPAAIMQIRAMWPWKRLWRAYRSA